MLLEDTRVGSSNSVFDMQLPDYHDVIEHPMDFATVRKKLGNGSYTTLEQFEVCKLDILSMLRLEI